MKRSRSPSVIDLTGDDSHQQDDDVVFAEARHEEDLVFVSETPARHDEVFVSTQPKSSWMELPESPNVATSDMDATLWPASKIRAVKPTFVATVPGEPPVVEDVETTRLHARVKAMLLAEGKRKLFSHQVDCYDKIMSGKNVMICTTTGSGKTLAVAAPILELLLKSDMNVLYIFPLKELCNDQFEKLKRMSNYFPEVRNRVVLLVGDTAPEGAFAVGPRVLIMTPDKLNFALSKAKDDQSGRAFFAKLNMVVFDEVHSLRGVFGANCALLLCRLRNFCFQVRPRKQVSELPGRDPRDVFQLVLMSGSVGNPQSLCDALSGRVGADFEVISNSGAEKFPKTFVISRAVEYKTRSDVIYEWIQALNGKKTLVFLDSIADAQRVADRCGARCFHASMKTIEKAKIIEAFTHGNLSTIVATSGLEAGVDFSNLDAVMLVGFPLTGTNSLVQRNGRCGRSKPGLVVFLSFSDSPYDSFVSSNPTVLMNPIPHHVNFGHFSALTEKHLMAALSESGSLEAMFFSNFEKDLSRMVQPCRPLQRSELTQLLLSLNFRGTSKYSVDVYCGAELIESNISGRTIFFRLIPKGRFMRSTSKAQEKFRVVSLDLRAGRAVVEPTSEFMEDLFPDIATTIDVNSVARTRSVETVLVTTAKTSLKLEFELSFGIANRTQRLVGAAAAGGKGGDGPEMFKSSVSFSDPTMEMSMLAPFLCVSLSVSSQTRLEAEKVQIVTIMHSLSHALIKALPLAQIGSELDVLEYFDGSMGCLYLTDGQDGGNGVSAAIYDSFERVLEIGRQLCSACKCTLMCPNCLAIKFCRCDSLSRWALTQLSLNQP